MLNELYKNQLSKPEQKVYETIKQGLNSNQDRIVIRNNINNSRLSDINIALDNDCPELYFANLKITQGHYSPGQIIANYSRKLHNEDLKLVNSANSILKEININEHSSDLSKYRAIHNWLVRNVTYCKSPNTQADYYSNIYNVKGPILDREAVCEGISKAYQYLCHLAGLECSIQSGQALHCLTNRQEGHCWNLVSINNQIQYVDVTWDLNLSNASRYNRYDYFLFSDKEATDRMYDPVIHCPEINKDYFHSKKLFFNNSEILYKFLNYKIKKKSKIFYFKLDTNAFDIEQTDNEVLNYLANKCGGKKVTSHSNKQKGILFYRVLF